MHNAVEENMAIGADKSAGCGAAPRDDGGSGEILLEGGVSRPSPNSQTELADGAPDKNAKDRNQRSTDIGVEEAMPRI